VTPDPKPANRGGTECKRGHSLEDAYISADGRRHCRACARQRNVLYRARRGRLESDRLRDREAYQRQRGANTKPCLDCGTPVVGYSSLQARRCIACREARYHSPRPCPRCGKEFTPGYARLRYCSRECAFAKLSAERGGDGNPGFRTGKRVGVNIPGWRLQAKRETCCRNCGDRDRLQLHHAIPRGKWTAGRADLRNGIPLCFACHHGWHHHRVATSSLKRSGSSFRKQSSRGRARALGWTTGTPCDRRKT